jgi:hypothetical protein
MEQKKKRDNVTESSHAQQTQTVDELHLSDYTGTTTTTQL